MRPVRKYHHSEFSAAALVDHKGHRTVGVCLPARNEAATVGPIVACLRDGLAGLVDDVVVVDDHSTDGTAAAARAAGARVVTAGSILGDHGWGPGKGGAMREAVAGCDTDLIVFCDADVTNFSGHFVTGLVGPLLAEPELALVKAFYDRPLDGRPGEGGRVTELVARPLLSMLFPELASVAQPLAGECAARRDVLEAVPFAHGYGVELGLLIDVAAAFGVEALGQVDLGTRIHRNRPLAELAPQATAVLRAALDRAGLPATPGTVATFLRGDGETVPVAVGVHPPLSGLRDRRSA